VIKNSLLDLRIMRIDSMGRIQGFSVLNLIAFQHIILTGYVLCTISNNVNNVRIR